MMKGKEIIELINCMRDHVDMGISLRLGRLIDAIEGNDEVYRIWLLEHRPAKITTDYEASHVSRIDDLTTDLWGGAGPDCSTQPV